MRGVHAIGASARVVFDTMLNVAAATKLLHEWAAGASASLSRNELDEFVADLLFGERQLAASREIGLITNRELATALVDRVWNRARLPSGEAIPVGPDAGVTFIGRVEAALFDHE